MNSKPRPSLGFSGRQGASRLRAAIFASQFHPHFGGVEELVRQQAHQLVRMGHEVVVVTNRWPKDLAAYETIEGLPIRRHAFRCVGGSWRQTAGALLHGPGTVRRLCAQMQDFSPDVIHVQCLSANAEYAVRVKQRLHLPLIVTLQGEFTMDAGGVFQRPDVQAGVRRVLGHADLITGCSAKTLADGEAICGYSFGSRARVIFNGAKVGDFSTAKAFIHPKPYVLALGRAVRQKGFDVLLRAWALLKETQWDLLIAGEGPELPALATLSRELCLEKSVHLLGRADRSRVTALFAGCDIFALPSRADEGLPVVCAEALAAGRATVATRVGGVPEVVIDGTTGLIVPKEDAPALAGALRLLIDAPVLRAAFADAARRRSNQFSWTAITDQYLEAYRSVIASTKASCKSCLC